MGQEVTCLFLCMKNFFQKGCSFLNHKHYLAIRGEKSPCSMVSMFT